MNERWKPKEGEEYYFLDSTSTIESERYEEDYIWDEGRIRIGNCFKTAAEAKAAAAKVKALLLSLQDNDKNLQDNIQDRVTNTCQAMDKGEENVAKWTRISGNLPKLTAEVFDRPDCPKWAKFAAVDQDGAGAYFESKPSLPSWCPWWDRSIGHRLIDDFEKWDASDWQNSLVERPAKKPELPDWCKVGEWCFCLDDDGNCKYFKITKIKDNFIYGEDCDIDYHFVKQARLRPYTADEMKTLVGKVVGDHGGMFLVTAFVAVDGGEVCVDGVVYNADDLLECYTINGEPCGVFEHLNEKGEWVE